MSCVNFHMFSPYSEPPYICLKNRTAIKDELYQHDPIQALHKIKSSQHLSPNSRPLCHIGLPNFGGRGLGWGVSQRPLMSSVTSALTRRPRAIEDVWGAQCSQGPLMLIPSCPCVLELGPLISPLNGFTSSYL